MDVVKEDFIASEGLKFTVKDYDALGRNDTLGFVSIPAQELCEASGERKTYNLLPPENSKKPEAGVINVRCRPATNYDRKFLEYSNGDQTGDFMGIDQNMAIAMKPRGGSKKLIKTKLTTVGKCCSWTVCAMSDSSANISVDRYEWARCRCEKGKSCNIDLYPAHHFPKNVLTLLQNALFSTKFGLTQTQNVRLLPNG